MKTKNVTEKNMKVCLVGSSGGHLTHLYMLKPFWKDKNRFWVTFDHRYLSRTQPQNRKVENAPHDFCRRWVDDKLMYSACGTGRFSISAVCTSADSLNREISSGRLKNRAKRVFAR